MDDHCAALVTILNAPAEHVVGEVFNVGTDEERSILQNAHTVLAVLDKPESMITLVPDRLGHVRRHAVNSGKLRARLGWAPQTTFEEGIAQAVAWYRENTAWLENLLARQDTFLDRALTLASSES